MAVPPRCSCCVRRLSPRAPVRRSALQFLGRQLELVDIAPSPFLARLEAPHDGMVGFVEVFRGVLVGRLIAAAHVAAFETQAKVDPPPVGGETLLTALRRLRLDVADLPEVRALRKRVHTSSSKSRPLGPCAPSVERPGFKG